MGDNDLLIKAKPKHAPALAVGDDKGFVRDAEGDIRGVPIVQVNHAPLQIPGRHSKVREDVIGGPMDRRDRRMFLHQSDLERMLDMAKASLSRRVQMDMVGLRVITWRTDDGWEYETWHIISIPPKPEHTVADELKAGLAR